MGDFNFPNINWDTHTVHHTHSRDHINQCEQLLSFMESNFLSQLVMEPTRNNNILDLLLTNNDRIFSQTKVFNTSLSDHNIVKSDLLFNPMVNRGPSKPPTFQPYTLVHSVL